MFAVLQKRLTAHQLHHEVWSAGDGPPRVEHLGDERVIHRGQRLALGHEPRDHLASVHSELDDFERHPPPDRLPLLGLVDNAHSAFTDLCDWFVRSDQVGHRVGRDRRERLEGLALGSSISGEQAQDARLQRRVLSARVVEKRRLLGRRELQARVEQFLLVHRVYPARPERASASRGHVPSGVEGLALSERQRFERLPRTRGSAANLRFSRVRSRRRP